jgi:tRNA-specific 2-thiouridylase
VKVAIAMSGGVDSSVAAALLQEEGHEVIGLTMQLFSRHNNGGGRDACEDARKVASRLGIPHYVVDFRELFARTIIDDFCREYNQGRTPNPCVLCNNLIKFGALWKKAAGLGADCLATGHYARVVREGDEVLLKKGADTKKDQSYFLCRLTREQLGHVLFPVGHLTKTEVRRIARQKGLPATSRPESREICFIPDNDLAGFLKSHSPQPSRPGPILDGRGTVVGEHRGIGSYTIGQRHGLGIAAAEPLYVTAIAPDRNAVIVGTKAHTYGTELVAGSLNWLAIDPPALPINVKARVRYRHPEVDATLTPLDDGEYYVNFAAPQAAITPGQTIAFYDGDTVLGGGMIVRQGNGTVKIIKGKDKEAGSYKQ